MFLGFDTAVSMEAALVKHLESLVAAAADVLVESGNMLARSNWSYLGAARLAVVGLGAKAPIVLPSRAGSAEGSVAFCVVASLFASQMPAPAFVQGE